MALLPFAHRIGIARRDVGEFLVAADLRRDLPGAGAFASLSRLEDDGDTLDVIETEGISRSFAFDQRRIGRLLTNAGIVRNRLKIESTVSNARAFLELQREAGSFDRFVWGFVGGSPKINRWRSLRNVPAKTRESDGLSAALKQSGFRFVGTTICYAFMQATGLVNDHLVSCDRYREIVHA